jgi:methionine-rich copper-binding protein CopC
MTSFLRMRIHFRTLLRSGLVSGLALWLALLAGVNIAAAHAELAESNPANGALLDEPPEQVWLRFTQELETGGSSLAVFDQNGQQVDVGGGGVDLDDLDHQRMVASLPASLADGTYTVRWTAVSAEDGDTTNGAISFTVGGPVTVGEAPPADTSSSPSFLLLLAAFIVMVLVVAGAVTIGRKRRVREGVK